MKNIYFTLLIAISLFSCKNEEEEFWNGISLEDGYRPFTFTFSDSENPMCGEYAQKTLRHTVENDGVSGISSSKVNGLVMFPSLTDPLYNVFAGDYKKLFDDNGDKSLTVWPSFFNNFKNYGIDSLAWQKSIKDDLAKSPDILLGGGIKFKGSRMGTFIKLKYVNSVNVEHGIAILIYYKTTNGEQQLLSGKTSFVHKNTYYNTPNNAFGVGIDKSVSAGKEIKTQFNFETQGLNRDNLGVIAVVYEMDANKKPKSVINSILVK